MISTKEGGGVIHDPIHSDTDPRDETGVVGMRLTPLFVFILRTLLLYCTHLPWCAVMEICLAGYGRKGIDVADKDMSGCTHISGSLYMTIQIEVFIETIKSLGSDLR